MVLTIEFLQDSIKETKSEILSIETQLSSSLKTEEWAALKQKTEKTLIDYRKITEERKRSKFLHDTEDYATNRVYRWSENVRTPRWRPYYRHQVSGSSGSESERSVPYPRPPFLGEQAMRARGRPYVRGGRGRSMPDYQTGVTTRSQVSRPPLHHV